jgi:hypothetical protein
LRDHHERFSAKRCNPLRGKEKINGKEVRALMAEDIEFQSGKK